MYLFYIDESGNPNGWDTQDNFILGGVAVHEGQIRGISDKVDQLQQDIFPDIKIPIEFHAQHVHSGKGRYRKETPERRQEVLDSICDIIVKTRFPSLIAFVTAIHVSAVKDHSQVMRDCLEDICERFNTFLVRQYKNGYPDKGLLIIDRSGRDAQIREIMLKFEAQGTTHGYLGNIVDVPYFADSRHTRMLQLADMVAFAGGRYFNSGDDALLRKILPRIDRRSASGDRVGLKHIVGSGHKCSCIASH